MNFIFYYFFILPISYLPKYFLYFFSNLLYVFLARVLKYRKKIIHKNLKNSFPEKTENEIFEIRNNFYKHFCDLIVESFRGFSISIKSIEQKITIKNQDLLNDFAEKGQNIILIGGHYNNWEMTAQRMPLVFKHDLFAIYKPLKNKFFDRKMKSSREKFGLNMISMKETKAYFNNETDTPRAIIFGSDQSPSNSKKAYWTKFLNQDSAFLYGAEKYAKSFNWPVIYVSINKIKRGDYLVEYQLITQKPKEESYGEIIKKFAFLLESDIKNQPEYWLWTHNRWKKKKI
ncbi:MAG: lipid A biosynthesis acyltransferase [Crocinitomicaceae bacterium]|nr:lipid A biosynthesis acyltransferase [Crocinitomicaceae bacterium]|tara:strand:+ start:8304 stop:9164 length:861 start_codon:yes stop_codon:yes gene_type:complete